jgi:hypothetical protein
MTNSLAYYGIILIIFVKSFMKHVPDCLGDYRIFETIQFIQNALLETFCLKKEGGLQERGGKG